MGIRVNKVIGFGSDQFEMGENGFCDPRFDVRGSWELVDSKEKERVDLSEDVLATNKEQIMKYVRVENRCDEDDEKAANLSRSLDMDFKLSQMDIDQEKRYGFYDPRTVNIYNDCSDFPRNGLVLVPPGCGDWFRHDDIMDYYEDRDSEGSFTYLDDAGGIYPYLSGWRRFRGESREGEPLIINGGQMNRITGKWSKDIDPMVSGEVLRDFQENWRPILPRLIIAWVVLQPWISDKWGFLNELRPCIFVYWC